jgi:hypothetical protein
MVEGQFWRRAEGAAGQRASFKELDVRVKCSDPCGKPYWC